MKRIVKFASLLLFFSCATVKLWWGATVDCAKQDSGQILATIPVIAQQLLSKDWLGAVQSGAKDLSEVETCAMASIENAALHNSRYVNAQQGVNASRCLQALNLNHSNVLPLPGE